MTYVSQVTMLYTLNSMTIIIKLEEEKFFIRKRTQRLKKKIGSKIY